MPTTVRSHAKINLGLGIGARRPDGFHGLVTVYQTLEMHDLVTVSARPATETMIRITSNDERVPTDERNTAWRVVEHALQSLKRPSAVDVHIEKRLPIQGGLGGGSANGVAALVGLEFELAREDNAQRRAGRSPNRPPENACFLHDLMWWVGDRLRIAEQIGSDLPLFLMGGAVLGLDRGQEVYPLPDIKPALWCVVAMPNIGVSTPQAFRDWDSLWANKPGFAAPPDCTYGLSRAYGSIFGARIPRGAGAGGSSLVLSSGEDLADSPESPLLHGGISRWLRNDFEEVVFPQHPSLAEIKGILLAEGSPNRAAHASLSGSGSALYGLYRNREDAEAAQSRLNQAKVRNELTRTISRSAYRREMIVEERD